LHTPLAGQVGLFAGMKPRERVAVLLTFLAVRAGSNSLARL
jgi:hypothetical protein